MFPIISLRLDFLGIALRESHATSTIHAKTQPQHYR